jgi:NAD(P)-dependent dehydrogenase (short-subunit alcohol dehydrogenase family)
MKHIVITGVSTGIGYAAAQALLGRGYHVFGSVRKQEDADRLQTEWGKLFTPLLFDVTDGDAISYGAKQVANAIGDEGLCGLVNNAGIAVPGPVMQLPVDEYRRQFEVNLFGQIAVIQPSCRCWGRADLARIHRVASLTSARSLARSPTRFSQPTPALSTHWRRSPTACAES